jgi:hypothetical protein
MVIVAVVEVSSKICATIQLRLRIGGWSKSKQIAVYATSTSTYHYDGRSMLSLIERVMRYTLLTRLLTW